MAFSGQWELEGKQVVYDFNATSNTVTLFEQQDGGVDDDEPSRDTPPPISVHAFALRDGEQVLVLSPPPTQQQADHHAATTTTAAATLTYQVVARCDTRITLRRLFPDGADSMEEEVLVLVPVGLPDTLRNAAADEEEEDGNDSGVDLGMDLCIVGKKI